MSEKIQNELKSEGLRIATENESGWYWKSYDENDERVTLWVTDEKPTIS